MKIAVACMGAQVAGHFGHCENFRIYEADNGQIQSEESIPNPGHRPGLNIEVVVGVQGDARDAVERWLRGELKSTGSICHEHQHEHEHECGGHCGH